MINKMQLIVSKFTKYIKYSFNYIYKSLLLSKFIQNGKVNVHSYLLAPFSNNNLTTSRWPFEAAHSNNVVPVHGSRIYQ